MAAPDDAPIRSFPDAEAFGAWLAEHGRTTPAVWLRFYKKHAGVPSISKSEAIDVALAWGWIDGQLGKGDEASWLTRFTPRGPKSVWSKLNRERVERLIAEGRMQPAGLAQVEAARADGRWDRAYDKQSELAEAEDLLAAIAADPAALATYQTLNRQNRFAFTYRVNDAKRPETRRKRIANFVAMLARGETLYPNGGRR